MQLLNNGFDNCAWKSHQVGIFFWVQDSLLTQTLYWLVYKFDALFTSDRTHLKNLVNIDMKTQPNSQVPDNDTYNVTKQKTKHKSPIGGGGLIDVKQVLV